MAYDVVVIGAGPGGYVCAIKAAQLGLKTAVIEKTTRRFGGTCVNIGCIPSKALLYASEMFAEAGHSFAALGVDVGTPKLNLDQMMAHKDAIGRPERQRPRFPDQEEQDRRLPRHGKLMGSDRHVSVTEDDGKIEEIEAKNIVIATGSDVAGIPGVKVDFDEKVIVSRPARCELAKVPATMVVVGGGVIGLELGSVWARLGAKVTVVEYLDTILGGMDGEVAKQLQRILAKQGIDVPARRQGHRRRTRPRKALPSPSSRWPGGAAGDASRRRSCWSPRGGAPLPKVSASTDAGVAVDERGRVKTDAICAPTSPASMQSATLSPGRCSRTRPRTRVWPWRKSSPARPGM